MNTLPAPLLPLDRIAMPQLKSLSHLFAILLCVLPCSLAFSQQPPNVIIFIADDVSWNDYGCYGNPAARTPNIDSLAANGIRFDNAYLTASSCSPSRSSIITGRYPHNNGKAAELHKPISAHLPWFPEILKQNGYYTALSGKHHMTMVSENQKSQARPNVFDHVDNGKTKQNSGGHANWVSVTRNRPKDQPFFFWFASTDAHRGWDADRQWDPDRYGPKHTSDKVIVPPFLIDDEETRTDLASYYNEVTRFDYYIGQVIKTLKNQNELDNTLIFVLADNGRPFPRAKTRLHDSGMKTALVAHWPTGIQSNGTSNSLMSVIDLAPTILSVAGCEVPKSCQGTNLQPIFADCSNAVRTHVFSEHNWHDYEALGRSVRHKNYMLLKNFRPELPQQGPADSVRSPSHKSLLLAQKNDKLTAAQTDVFLAPRPQLELYNVAKDPHQLNNLAGSKATAEIQNQLSVALDEWMQETRDSNPSKITPDTFGRATGERLKNVNTNGAITPGEDKQADRCNERGPGIR
ncbi:MAG: sulfatase [Fuerstiella sp.]